MKKVGLLTIGQAPRVDLVPEMKMILGKYVEIVEKGALDGLTLDEVKLLYPKEDNEVLVTRMADGTEVKVSEKEIIPRVKNQIKRFEAEGINTVILACTGEFPAFDSSCLIIRPQRVLHHVVSAISEDLTLGVIIPDQRQVEATKEKWAKVTSKVIVEPASPYRQMEDIERAAKLLKESDVDIVLMDCMGYTFKMKDLVQKSIEKPVILARSIVAKVASELV